MEAKAKADEIIEKRSNTGYLRTKYEHDPLGFCQDILGDHFTEGVVRVMESVRDNPVTIAKSGNGVGKSHAAARIALWFFSIYDDAKVYLTAAPPIENLRRILWGEMVSCVNKRPDIFPYRLRSLRITRNSLSFIDGVAIPTSGSSDDRISKFSGKHAPHLLFIVDEGDAVPPEIYRGIEGCMSGGMARMLIMFNPKSENGPVYDMEINRQANIVHLSAFEHPNVTTGRDVIPGAVTRETVVRRLDEWTRPFVEGEIVTDDVFEVPEFLVGSVAVKKDGSLTDPMPAGLRKIKEPEFSYMVLGQYPPQGMNRLIPENAILAALERHDAYVAQYGEVPPGGIRPVMGLDVAELGTDYNVAFFRYGGYVSPAVFWAGMDTDETTERALQLYRQRNASIAMIDATGTGSSIAPAMSRRGLEDDVRAISVKVGSKPSPVIATEKGEFRYLRDQLWWAVREWLINDPNAMLPRDHMLIEELRLPTYTNNLQNKIVVMDKDTMRDLLRRSPDRADALCMTFNPVYRPTILTISQNVFA